MAKQRVTRTYGPIHFEDLDPHRFEDLIRELIYDYKDWQSIEATGRSGSDEGFDIRAYEKAGIISRTENENDIEVEEVHPMEGNLWMIQGKREKEISPKKVQGIVEEIDEKNPPYGYILAASANFSKKSYDVFREVLRKKGVMEFYLWGKAELEDMLHLPKNDRILFTFFGISLVSKRRSRTTELRSIINIKNKLYRAVGEEYQFRASVLIRDLKDTHYPYRSKYKDFKEWPRWKEYVAFQHHPCGLWCHTREYFAYIDTEKKEWDFTDEVNLIHLESESNNERNDKAEKQKLVNDVWQFFPKINQGHFIIDGLVKYDDIALVDDKGDVLYRFPHLYVDFIGEKGPFAGGRHTLKIGNQEIDLTDEYKKVKVFPEKYQKLKSGKVHEAKKIEFDPKSLKALKEYGPIDTLYDSDRKYDFLKSRDIIPVAGTGENTDEVFIQITYKFKAIIKDYLGRMHDSFIVRHNIQQQLGREYDDNEEINIYEFRKIYKWELEEYKKV